MYPNKQSETVIVLKQKPIFLCVAFGACLMAVFGFRLLFGLLPLEDGYTPMDIFGVIFVCVWILLVLGMGCFALESASRKITIDREGVFCCSWFRKDFIAWYDIRDWGLSYCGQTRGEGNTYYLYFSKQECCTINDCKKKLKGKMIKSFVVGDDYYEAVNEVIPFCCERTCVKPFVGTDKYHFF